MAVRDALDGSLVVDVQNDLDGRSGLVSSPGEARILSWEGGSQGQEREQGGKLEDHFDYERMYKSTDRPYCDYG